MRYLSHVDEYLTLKYKYKYKYQVLHLWKFVYGKFVLSVNSAENLRSTHTAQRMECNRITLTYLADESWKKIQIILIEFNFQSFIPVLDVYVFTDLFPLSYNPPTAFTDY